jgi:N6-L-threonylcarbamoyladenine synthase
MAEIFIGVESTAHTFGVGVMDSTGRVLANVKDSYTSQEGGMIPDKVAGHHKEVASRILEEVFKVVGISWKDVSFIAYSAGPGLDPALWAGYKIVKQWAEQEGKKIVGVNHCCAHLSIGKIWNKLQDPCYLYVSGVNTQVIVQMPGVDGKEGKYLIMGETLDIGLGNMLDKFGRVIGLGFPAGAAMEQLALQGKYVELPYAVKGMDVSFSGILTKVEQMYKQGKISKEDACFSVQETCFAMCTEVVERAMAHTGKKELLLVGGVGANKRFCVMLQKMCEERGAVFYKVPMDLAGDQGAMIGWEGYLRREQYGDVEVNPHWRADEV